MQEWMGAFWTGPLFYFIETDDTWPFARMVLIVWGGLLWRMQTADWPLHLTERKVFNSGLYIEVLRGCLTCDAACSLVHLGGKKKLLKFTFSTSRWKHLFLQCRSAFWSYWDGVKAGLVHQCWRCCSRILKGNLHSLSCNITFFPPSDFYISQQYWLLCIVGAVHVAPQYGIDSSSKNELKREVFIYERNPAGVFVYIHEK